MWQLAELRRRIDSPVVLVALAAAVAVTSWFLCSRWSVAAFCAVGSVAFVWAALRWSDSKSPRKEAVTMLVLLLAMLPVLGIGAKGHDPEFLDLAVSDRAYWMFAAATGAAWLSLGLAARRWPVAALPLTSLELPPGSRLVVWVTSVASAVILLVNAVTGPVVVMAGSNMNTARFEGSGALHALNQFAVAGAQFSVAVLLMRAITLKTSRRTRAWLATAAAVLTVLLALSASRSFVLLALAPVVVLLFEVRLPPLKFVVAAAVVLFVGLGVVGWFRASGTTDAGYRAKYMESRGLPANPLGTAIGSLQTGPRIASLVIDSIPDRIPFQWGYFFVRDGAVLLPISADPADRWVTSEVWGKPVASQGGTPPTFVGGLYADFGVPGVIMGTAFFVTLVQWATARASRGRRLATLVSTAYVGSWVLLGLYSYFSLKPTVVTVVALSGTCWLADRWWPSVLNRASEGADRGDPVRADSL